jgi:mandelate racemase
MKISSPMPKLTIRSVRARAVRVPIALPLFTSRGTIGSAPLVLVDLETEEGIIGCGYAFSYMELAAPFICRVLLDIGEIVRGQAVDPKALYSLIQNRFTLIGTEGSLGMAVSAFDIACWDALAKAANLPLAKFLGAKRNTVPAYNSKGLSLKEPVELAAEAIELLAEGFTDGSRRRVSGP